ncbi:MAG: hypothetical protein WC965_01170 [Thiohalomonadaceae bacterium]
MLLVAQIVLTVVACLRIGTLAPLLIAVVMVLFGMFLGLFFSLYLAMFVDWALLGVMIYLVIAGRIET